MGEKAVRSSLARRKAQPYPTPDPPLFEEKFRILAVLLFWNVGTLGTRIKGVVAISKGMKDDDLTEAKEKVLELVRAGVPYRKIASMAFMVGGKERRFSISQISRMVREEREREEVHEREAIRGEVAARAFKLFEEGVEPADVVIRLEEDPGIIEKLYKSWAKMKGYALVEKSSMDSSEYQDTFVFYSGSVEFFRRWASWFNRNCGTNYKVVDEVDFRMFVYDLMEKLRSFNYKCAQCGKVVYARPDREWKDLVDKGYLSGWGHEGCRGQS